MDKGDPFILNFIISCKQFDYILSALCFTNIDMPYEDGFLKMRQWEEAWNKNMDQQFLPSLINVLDESMMEQFKKWAPRFMCVVRELHLFVNERHNICCALTSILQRAYIVEGKYMPTQLGKKKWEDLEQTIGFML